MCDVESYCYLPLCEELGYTPVRLNGDSFPFLLGCSSS